ncbi:hypothetical protein SKAU_G00092940 [Synaphobranchus kaupii]|uniref:EH domain-containing protein n=1 Tax=Synaphobranchus kaupii TaxID=118154 RepID=A0A9Q1FX28_SYNKA|nr:hypothetical protein SKAU_G00092940 [Synaphobranchus kaupii]
MALRPGPGGAGSFIYPVGGGLGPPQGLMPVQGPQPMHPMVQVMQPNMQGMMGINFGAQMPSAAVPMQGGLTMGIQAPGMQFVGQPQFISVRATGPQYTHIAEEHQKRLEQQQRLLEEDRKRRQFEEQKQKLRLLSSVKPKVGEKSRDDALEAIKGNLDGFSRDAKLHPTPSSHPKKAGVGVYPQQDHIQPLMPAWLYNDSLVPELFKKVLDFTLTPAGIDTAKLYPILMSSGLPREVLGQIWASANRTTPGKLTKEELYAVLAMIGVTQSGIPAMGLDILTTPTPVVIGMSPSTSTQALSGFIACFPPLQGPKPDDDDFQDFQEAPKAGACEDPFTDFQADPGSTAPPQHQTSVPAILTPVSRSSSLDKYAAFKQLSVEQAVDTSSPSSDKYSVFRQLEQPGERKSGEGFTDFKSASTDDGFTDFKTADTVSPSDTLDQTKTFHPSFPPPFAVSQPLHQQPQNPPSRQRYRNPLNMADLDLFAPAAPTVPAADPKSLPFPSTPPTVEPRSEGATPSGRADDFGDFTLFGSSASNSCSAATLGCTVGGGSGTALEEFADFLAFRSPGENVGDANPAQSGSRAKEDSTSVKSLDLPSTGGSSVGKEDSEDTLSVQLDMKLSEVGGDLKHVMSDSSLDLPAMSAHQPPASDNPLAPAPVPPLGICTVPTLSA